MCICDFKQMSVENTVKLLFNCANALNGESHATKLLKSYYINTTRKLAKFNVQLPDEHYGASKMCRKCGIPWHEGEFHLRLKPQRVKRTAKASKLIEKLEESKKKQIKGLLTKSQRKRAKWLKKRVVSNMQICCEFCQHKTLVPLDKQKKQSKNPSVLNEVVLQSNAIKKKSKKNEGLKAVSQKESVIKFSANPQSSTTKTLATNEHPTKQVHLKQPKKNKSNPVVSNVKKNNQKKQQKSKSNSAVKPKLQSKTQQQNSLLQLAALLKNQASKTVTNTAQNRFEALLK